MNANTREWERFGAQGASRFISMDSRSFPANSQLRAIARRRTADQFCKLRNMSPTRREGV